MAVTNTLAYNSYYKKFFSTNVVMEKQRERERERERERDRKR
jgi:hypothetical protein